jgi:DNA-binding MarR family transcriptional regulator
MAETKQTRVRLSETQILQIGREYMKKSTKLSEIAEAMKLDKSAVRNAVTGLAKAGVEFPDKPRETSSRYSSIASKLVSKE